MLYLYCTSYQVILYEFTFRDIISPQIIYTILITIQFLHLVLSKANKFDHPIQMEMCLIQKVVSKFRWDCSCELINYAILIIIFIQAIYLCDNISFNYLISYAKLVA